MNSLNTSGIIILRYVASYHIICVVSIKMKSFLIPTNFRDLPYTHLIFYTFKTYFLATKSELCMQM